MLVLILYFFGWFADQTKCQMMSPAQLQASYMKVPIAPLKQAIQYVPKFAFTVPACVDDSIKKSTPYPPLTQEEVAAIKLYTTECKVYKELNQALRSQNLKSIEPWFFYLKIFHTAIVKIPPNSGVYCRGVKEDLSYQYTVGSVVTWWSITSLSVSLKICKNFMKPDSYGKYTGTMFSVKSKSAREITKFSMYPIERESILLPGSQLKIISIKPSPTLMGATEIAVEEVQSQTSGAHSVPSKYPGYYQNSYFSPFALFNGGTSTSTWLTISGIIIGGLMIAGFIGFGIYYCKCRNAVEA